MDWRKRGALDASRYVRVSDGSQSYVTELPAGTTLAAACDNFRESSKYSGKEGELVTCNATLLEMGKEVARQEFRVACKPAER